MNKKIALCFLLGAAVMLAVDRNYKRVECNESIEVLLQEKDDQQPLLSTSDQSMQIYVNFSTGSYTIFEWDVAYNQYCVVSFGTNLELKGL